MYKQGVALKMSFCNFLFVSIPLYLVCDRFKTSYKTLAINISKDIHQLILVWIFSLSCFGCPWPYDLLDLTPILISRRDHLQRVRKGFVQWQRGWRDSPLNPLKFPQIQVVCIHIQKFPLMKSFSVLVYKRSGGHTFSASSTDTCYLLYKLKDFFFF